MTLAVQAGVRAMNGLGRTLRRLGLEPASLDETALIEAARRETGLDDFGPDDVWHPLRVLVGSLERDARLSWLGRIVARHDLRSILVNRLRLVRDRAMYPEISAACIERPIFVAGLPRTGSTLLHHLLAQDPGSRVMRAWEVIAPSPPPSPSGEGTDPRIAAVRRDLRWFDLI